MSLNVRLLKKSEYGLCPFSLRELLQLSFCISMIKEYLFQGPTPFPLVGNLIHVFQTDKIIFKALHKMSLEHGPIFTLWFGRRKQVVVSGVQELKVIFPGWP